MRSFGKKGFISFGITLAAITILLFFSQALAAETAKIRETTQELIIAEEANKERTLLENGFDKIVEKKLFEQVIKDNYNTNKAREEINAALSQYLKGKAYASNIWHAKTGEATAEFLNENSAVQMLKTDLMIYAEYTFTSNLPKTTTVSARFGRNIVSYFQMPAGYAHRIVIPR